MRHYILLSAVLIHAMVCILYIDILSFHDNRISRFYTKILFIFSYIFKVVDFLPRNGVTGKSCNIFCIVDGLYGFLTALLYHACYSSVWTHFIFYRCILPFYLSSVYSVCFRQQYHYYKSGCYLITTITLYLFIYMAHTVRCIIILFSSGWSVFTCKGIGIVCASMNINIFLAFLDFILLYRDIKSFVTQTIKL